jgi:DNA-binding transcriptional LysR family regulator
MDHLLAIRVFARVVETGSFTKAADSLEIPKATVSKLVQGLEAHLQVKLLQRTTRRVSVTADGAAYYERTGHLLSELDDIEATLGRAQGSPRGRLRVDTGGSVASRILIPALPLFQERYPDIQLQLGVTDRTVDLIGENVDCVIRSTANDPSLVTRRIGQLQWITCASPGYLALHGRPHQPREIETQGHVVASYFSAHTGRTMPLRFSGDGETIEIEGHHRIAVNESNSHVATALAGLGLVQTADFMARPHVDRGELIAVLDDWRPAPLPVYVAYPPNRHLSAKLRVFVDWVAELFAGVR